MGIKMVGRTLRYDSNIAGYDFGFSYTLPEKKSHWKEDQTESDKESRLSVAKKKRERKALKRNQGRLVGK